MSTFRQGVREITTLGGRVVGVLPDGNLGEFRKNRWVRLKRMSGREYKPRAAEEKTASRKEGSDAHA